MFRTVLLIGLGGGIGSILRYLTGVIVNKYTIGAFPYATFIVNILGCFIIGILLGLFERYEVLNSDLKYLFIVGFCGGYTTFSTFAVENIALLQSGNSFVAFMYIAASVLTGLLAVWVGLKFVAVV